MARRNVGEVGLALALGLLVLGGCDDGDVTGSRDAELDAAVGAVDTGPDAAPPRDAAPGSDAAAPPDATADPDAATPDLGPREDLGLPRDLGPREDMGPDPDMGARADLGADMGPGCAGPEICGNDEDEDCDGQIDDPDICDVPPGECRPDRPCDTGRPGVCADGRSRCPNGPLGEAACDPLAEPGDEVCDGARDEDCDGQIDEGFGLGEACAAGEGACRMDGVLVCGPDGAAACSVDARPPQDERCDGVVDDDCDGLVDEGFEGVGDACAVGDGLCRAEGRLSCGPDGDVRCDARPGAPEGENCNGADDDCDGSVDERWPELGEACSLGVGACRAEGVRVCLGGNRTICDAVPGLAGVEDCNGLDDDCDGEVDEGPDGPLDRACYAGPPGTAGVGQCRVGRQACVGGGWGECANEVIPAAEACNGVDDDCDGQLDEGQGGPLREACYAGAPGTEGVGICRGGDRVCRGGRFGACEGQVVPNREICDAADNDCNGVVDDVAVGGCDCDPATRRDCYGGPPGTEGVGRCQAGSQVCRADGTGYGACEGQVFPAAEEICNGEDDDCDGRTDEALPGVGEACQVGQGACAGDGVFRCDPARGLICDVNVGEPGDERCNGEDDDCDGAIDEGFRVGEQCALGIGVCLAVGEVRCAPDGRTSQCSARPGQPQDELCDRLDNDCDGRVDEFLAVGEPCIEGRGECLRRGFTECGAGGAVVCSAEAGAPRAERCDFADNDCDGRVDEAFALGEACEAGVGECRAAGLTRCGFDGGVACDARLGQPDPEACDGVDNDCDGNIDEGYALGVPCAEGLGECRREGETICGDDGEVTCSVQRGRPTFEDCDGLDNDCDGDTDEAFNVGEPCAAGENDCRRQGVFVCDGLFDTTCGAQPRPPLPEACNGEDDDCDGRLDEGFAVGRRCVDGEGACQVEGLTRCAADGAIECDVRAGQGGDETCNGIDDDCDGTTDEGFPVRIPCDEGVGACAAEGFTACDIGGDIFCTARPGEPVDEICDAVDNDCDGREDEGFAVGEACARGLGACRREGVNACDDGGALVCSAAVIEPGVETCDGADEDCDGRTDEGFAVGEACVAGEGVCGQEGQIVCAAGDATCDAVPLPAGVEECNDLDDDCDGPVDEGDVCPDLEPPVIDLQLQPIFVLFNGNGRVTVRVTDDRDPDPVVQVSIDGQPIQLDDNGQYLFAGNVAGAHEVRVVAIDAAGRRSEARDWFRVQNLDDNVAPVVRIIAPDDSVEIFEPTEIHGRLEDENFFSYTLQISVDGANFQTINTGMESGPDVIVGTIDPRQYPPGFLYVKLTGEDENSLNQFQIIVLRIPDGISVGESKIGIRDFAMPLKGIPISIDRDYDSLRRFQKGDFGWGWRLTTDRVRVVEDLQSNVFVGLPDGRREVFSIAYQFAPFFPIGTMSYVAPDGVASTLESPQACAIVNSQAGPVCFNTGRPPAQSINTYVLTTVEGTEYVLHDVNGLQQVTDREGNRITFQPDRITSNLGVEISIDRDAEGRVTTITDPKGGELLYRYDGAGDLVEVEDQLGGVQRYRYDDQHKLIEVIGPDGNPVSRTEYDEDGRKLSETDALGRSVVYTYDDDNNTQTVTDRRGGRTIYTYDAEGRVTSRVDALGHEATYAFDADGNLASEVQAGGRTFAYAYDATGNQTRITLPDDSARGYEYNDFGKPVRLTDPFGEEILINYDDAGRITGTRNASGGVLAIEYDEDGNRAAVVEADGNRVEFAYDALGNITGVNRAGGFGRTYAYNAAAELTRITDGDDNTVGLGYDAVGRLVQVVDPFGGEITVERDPLGRMTAITDVDDSVRRYSYEPRGLLATATDALGEVTAYSYDEEGALDRITYADDTEVRYTRDLGGAITSREDPLGNVETMEYDAAGRMIARVDRNGDRITYGYDPMGRLASLSDPIGGDFSYEWDANGRLAADTGPLGRTTFEHDADGRLLAEVHPGGLRIEHSWSTAGKRTARNGPEGATTYAYDGLRRLISLQDPELGEFALGRDPEGRLSAVDFPNGVVVSYQRDPLGRPIRWEARRGMEVLAGETWTFDAVGRPTRVERDDGHLRVLEYDSAGQLVRSTLTLDGAPVRDVSYQYDARGGRIGRTVDGVPDAHVLDADQRLQRDAAFDYTYDAVGNLLTKTRRADNSRFAFDYDAEQRLRRIVRPDGEEIVFNYRPSGALAQREIGATTRNDLHDFGERAWVTNAAGDLVERYVYGDQVDQALALVRGDSAWYFALDGAGNVAAVFDDAGAMVGRYLYDDFGALLDNAGEFESPLLFQARPYDPQTGLYDFRQRVYDPAIGRFLQQDAEAGRQRMPLSQHPYIYGNNNPWLYRDPSGRTAAISYAFLANQFVGGTGSVETPSAGEIMGAFIGFFHGFSAGALVFLANILELASSGADVLDNWGVAIARTEAKLAEIEDALGRFSAVDNSGFAGAFVGGAQFKVGIKFELNLPGPVGMGIGLAGGEVPSAELSISAGAGGFKSGGAEFLNFARLHGPR